MLSCLSLRGRGLLFTLAFVVHPMSQDMPDQYDLVLEENLDDQAVLVAADIHDDEMLDPIGART